ncbi:MAG: DNA processing protein DprA [Opitutia bacterium UBA7350]|nr:MAG: DNA processing protein DprA [Opitutae bacterium UBA7350]
MSRNDAMLILNALPQVGPILMGRLLEYFKGDPLAILSSTVNTLLQVHGVGSKIAELIIHWERYFDLTREKETIALRGAIFLDWEHPDYPALLKEMYDSPIGIYWLGNYTTDRPCIAVIGTRQPSLYGLKVARILGAQLAGLGFCVVSGMARGVDSAAHEGALECGGPTIAVLGSGLDIIYPPENKELYDRIIEKGAVVSEFPFGRRVDRQTFPMRNRLVAGMCEAVIVVETGAGGGSMITARFAGEQGRLLMAVPGRIDQVQAKGCLQLIRDGAILVSTIDDILEELRYERNGKEKVDEFCKVPEIDEALSVNEQAVLSCLLGGELGSLDSLATQTGLPVHEVSVMLVALELKRKVVKRLDGRYEAHTI